jgi:hypothetical protein
MNTILIIIFSIFSILTILLLIASRLAYLSEKSGKVYVFDTLIWVNLGLNIIIDGNDKNNLTITVYKIK